jgi:hypothetical protein
MGFFGFSLVGLLIGVSFGLFRRFAGLLFLLFHIVGGDKLMAKYPEKFLLKLPEGTLGRIDAVSGNRSDFIRDAIEDSLGGVSEKKNSIVAPVSVKGPVGSGKPLTAYRQLIHDASSPAVELPDEPQNIPENIPSVSPRERDKELLLSLIRGKSLTSRSARDALGLPGLRYDNAEKALLTDGVIAIYDGILTCI